MKTTSVFSGLFFLLLGFVIGFIFACYGTLEALDRCAKTGRAFIGNYRVIEVPEVNRDCK